MSAAQDDAQCTSEQLKTMSPEEIVKAQQEGRLDAVLAGREPRPK
ncbi:hypothetical protein [Arthrobacter sp. M4]|nr:hypothetical protein [Arthrobacter sp. M4]